MKNFDNMKGLKNYLKEIYNKEKCTKKDCAIHKHFENIYYYENLRLEKILTL